MAGSALRTVLMLGGALVGSLPAGGLALAAVPGIAHALAERSGLGAWADALGDGPADALAHARAERAEHDAAVAALEAELAKPAPAPTRPYIVVSVHDRVVTLWNGDELQFRARAAVGMGTAVLDGEVFSFETPRGVYKIQEIEDAPVWNAPDWHYKELATKKGVDSVPVTAKRPVTLADGSRIELQGDTLARCAGETCTAYGKSEEIVADGKLIVPPVGTVQRQYEGVLGTYRLKMGFGYAIHGTNKPSSIGRAASHGCIRLRNEDIAVLAKKVNVGTPILVY